MVGSRDSKFSLHWRRRTHKRRCLRVRWSVTFSGVLVASYSSSGAEHLDRSGSCLFMEQNHLAGSFFASTTPRSRRHCGNNGSVGVVLHNMK